MANRGDIRAGIQKLIQDTAAADWSVAELNEIINESMQSLQEFILMIDPEAFTVWQKRSIVANERHYLRPVDMIWDVEFGYSATPATLDYAPLERVPFQQLRSDSGGRTYAAADGAGTYAKTGNYYYLGWTPDAAITDGLQTIYTPWLAMDEDTDVPALSLGFHRMIKIDAAIKILQETPQDTSKMELERAEFMEKIKRYYRSSATTPDLLAPDLGKTY